IGRPGRLHARRVRPTRAMDVNGLNLTGVSEPAAADLERAAADSVKRVLRSPATDPDWTADPGTHRLTAFLETKTVWHPSASDPPASPRVSRPTQRAAARTAGAEPLLHASRNTDTTALLHSVELHSTVVLFGGVSDGSAAPSWCF